MVSKSDRMSNLLLLIFRLHPFAVFADQIHEAIHGFGFGDVEFEPWRAEKGCGRNPLGAKQECEAK